MKKNDFFWMVRNVDMFVLRIPRGTFSFGFVLKYLAFETLWKVTFDLIQSFRNAVDPTDILCKTQDQSVEILSLQDRLFHFVNKLT